MRAGWNKTIFTAILIGAALGISAGALSAYMTSSETATNTFTAGEVKIDLQEPAWKPEDGKHLVAKQTVLKDPKIKNTGKNPAYVFMTVQVPVRTLTLYNDAGRKEEYSETTELFNLKKNVNGIYETLSDTNSGNWVLLKDRSTYGTKDESFTTYVYAYSVPVDPNATSEALFDAVQLKNVIEGYSEMSKISTKDEYPITINGYAIQATDVIGTDGSDVTDGTVTTDDLLRMYDTYVNQNGTGTGSSMNLMTDPSTQYKDGKMVIPELPKKTGYKNDGLWHDDNGNTYAAGTEVTVTDEMKQNGFNLHVNWKPITYTVRFDSNGGSGTMEDLTMTYDEAATLPANAFTKGTKFIGWSLSQTGSINFKDGAMIRNLSETDGDTVTLYALWKQNQFKVTYNANGGYYGTDTSKTTNTVTYQKNQFFPKISKTDNVNEDGTDYSGGYGNNVNKTEVVTIPCAEKLKVTITYQTESSNYDYVCMWEGTHPEYTASNNYSSSRTGKLGGAKNTRKYTVAGDTVTFGFRSDGSNNNYFGYYAVVEGEGISLTVKNGTFMQPSHLENLFVGWYTDAAGTEGHEFSLEDCERNTTVYAKWREPIVTLLDGSEYAGITQKLRIIAGNYRTENITAFQRSSVMPDVSKMTNENIISTEKSDVPVYCWKDGDALKWWSKAKTVKANTSLSYVFSDYTNLSDISGLSDIDPGNVTDMEYMFDSCRSLTDLSPLASWNTGNVTNMYRMFWNCNSLTDLSGLSKWNTGKATNMSNMFAGCSSLTNLSYIANWDTGNVTNMGSMFDSCSKLTDLSPIANWGTENMTSIYGMFSYCRSLTDLGPLANWDIGNVTNMNGMFRNCSSLTNLSPIANWDTGNVISMSELFKNCSSITDLNSITTWDTGKVTNMGYMFDSCSSLTDLNGLTKWNTGNVTDMGGMFDSCSSLTDLSPLASWSTGNVTDMSDMFWNCSSLTDLSPLANWSTGNVTNMYRMFLSCNSISDISPLANWDTAKVTNMGSMFSSCSIAELSPLANWNTGNVTDMRSMFYKCSSLTDISPLANWNTGNVTNMSGIFSSCSSLTDISPLANWSTGNVTDMSGMFNGCNLTDLNPLTNWNTGNVTNMRTMFAGCRNLSNLSPLANWNTGNVTNMRTMFSYCSSLTDLSALANWNTGNVTDMRSMFSSCSSLANVNGLANWNTENVTNMDSMFQECKSLANLNGLANWNTENVTNMFGMFWGCNSLTDASGINDWDIQKVTSFSCMFVACPSHPTFTKRAGTWDSNGTFTPAA